jgi:4,5-DOPA dioxygenase extradiol
MTATHPSSAGKRMPVVFIGHGSPENALEDNAFTRNWKSLASSLPRPKAILCISAHWLTEGTAVTGMAQPRTIHDFYGFPEPLNKFRYPAKGSPDTAARIAKSIATAKVKMDEEWGLDHGTWSVLAQMYPRADVPVVQMSLDYYLPPARQYQIGRELQPLRDHLMAVDFHAEPFAWALEFDGFVERALAGRDDDALIRYNRQPSAPLAHPTFDHYLPLLYVLGAGGQEPPRQFNGGIFAGSVGMRCAVFGE